MYQNNHLNVVCVMITSSVEISFCLLAVFYINSFSKVFYLFIIAKWTINIINHSTHLSWVSFHRSICIHVRDVDIRYEALLHVFADIAILLVDWLQSETLP